MFRKGPVWIGLVAVVILGCDKDTPVGPSAGRMTVSVAGTVQSFVLRDVIPFALEKGDPVELVLSYVPEADSARCTEADVGVACYYFGFNDSWLTVRIGSQSWTVPLQQAGFLDTSTGDSVSMAGITLSMSFPGQLGEGIISAYIGDDEPPYDMLSGAQIQYIHLDGEITGGLVVKSPRFADGSYWSIGCLLSTSDTLSSTQP